MAHLGTLRDYAFDRDVDDIRGTAVYGRDGDKLGKVDDVIFDHHTGDIRYAVVDTGGWLSSKKFLVPAEHLHGYDKEENAFQVDMLKERIEQFPRYDEKSLESKNDWDKYEDHYKRLWDEGPVQHREDRLDLNITPATVTTGTTVTGVPRGSMAEIGSDVPRGSLGEDLTDDYVASDEERARLDDERLQRESMAGEVTPHHLAEKFPETLQTPDKIQINPSHVVPVDPRIEQREVRSTGEVIDNDVRRSEVHRAGVGEWHPRMRRFEDVLRRNRVDVTASCAACAPKKDKAA